VRKRRIVELDNDNDLQLCELMHRIYRYHLFIGRIIYITVTLDGPKYMSGVRSGRKEVRRATSQNP
jgi:hypothetical protein